MSIGPLAGTGQRLRFWGLASGLDVDQIVSQLMQVERIPLERLEQRRQLLVWTKQDYLGVYGLLDQVRQSLTPLKLAGTFQARRASSSAEDVVTALASSIAEPGVHEIRVQQLAQGIRLASSGPISRSQDRSTLWTQFGISDSVQTFELTLQMTDSRGQRSVTLTLDRSDPQRDDIRDLVAAINDSGLGVVASYDATFDRLFIRSQETDSAVTLQVTDATVDVYDPATQSYVPMDVWEDLLKLGDPSTPFTGQDAIFDLDGATGLRASSNQVTVAGVTYTLRSVGSATVTVAQDTDGIVAAIRAFIDRYNEALSHINQKVGERRLYDYPPLTDAQKEEMTEEEIQRWEERARQGLLQGDSLLTGVVSGLRMDVADPVKGLPAGLDSLAAIGITTGAYQEGGLLHLDESKLRQALQQDPEVVMRLFVGDAGQGIEGMAARLSSTLTGAMDRIRLRAGVMGLDADNSGLGRQIASLDDQILRMEERLTQIEARYYRQYSLMEQVVGQLNAQSAWLAQVFLGQGQQQ